MSPLWELRIEQYVPTRVCFGHSAEVLDSCFGHVRCRIAWEQTALSRPIYRSTVRFVAASRTQRRALGMIGWA